MQTLLSAVCQLPGDLFPGNSLFDHQNHHMIEKIGNLVLNLFRVRIFGCDDDLGGLLAAFL